MRPILEHPDCNKRKFLYDIYHAEIEQDRCDQRVWFVRQTATTLTVKLKAHFRQNLTNFLSFKACCFLAIISALLLARTMVFPSRQQMKLLRRLALKIKTTDGSRSRKSRMRLVDCRLILQACCCCYERLI